MSKRSPVIACHTCGLPVRGEVVRGLRPRIVPATCKCITPGVRSARAMLDALPVKERNRLRLAMRSGDVAAVRRALEAT